VNLRARLTRLRRDDAGNAMLEFVALAVMLMLPLVYVLLSVFAVQRAGYAVTTATREAARAYVLAEGSDEGLRRAYVAAEIAMADQGMSLSPDELAVHCSASPCLTPGAKVEVSVDTQVALPFLPNVFAGRAPASVAVHGRSEEPVETYRAVLP
jgi:Flp pilus assembly protein TadG